MVGKKNPLCHRRLVAYYMVESSMTNILSKFPFFEAKSTNEIIFDTWKTKKNGYKKCDY